MKISIITVVLNNHKKIANSIESVLSQKDVDLEYIIVDGGSNDSTREIIEAYSNRISKFISEPDKGLYDALNKGILLSTGDIIGILHSDDIFENEHILKKIAESFCDAETDGVYGDLVYVKKTNPDKVIRFWKSSPYMPSLLKQGWVPPHPTLFLKRAVFDTYGLYNTRFQIASDYDFMLRVLSNTELKFIYLPLIITRMCAGGYSNRNIINILRKSCEDYLILRKNKIGGLSTLFMKNVSKLKQFLVLFHFNCKIGF